MQKDLCFRILPGFLIGASLAGFFDGILLHQILQWHHMICIESHCVFSTVETLKQAQFYDGLFHAVMWLALLVGLIVFVNRLKVSVFNPSYFWGTILLGAGAFNVVEGVVNHHTLQIHHVRFGPGGAAWDFGYLLISAIIALFGWRKMNQANN
jgi:uncharacterized membrane protein